MFGPPTRTSAPSTVARTPRPMAALKSQIGKTPDLVILVLETLLYDIRKMGRELGQVRATLERKRAAK